MTVDLAWYLHRFRAMSVAEVGHRVVERGLRARGRGRDWGVAFARPAGPLPRIAVDRDALARMDPSVVDGFRAMRRDLAAGRLTLLDRTWPVAGLAAGGAAPRGGVVVPWHRDPATGADWPAQPYCFDVPYRGESGRADVKFVWELNRLQFLPPLAALAVLDRDEALAELCWALVASWIDANPPYRGVAWASGIELALRSVSLLLVIGLLGEDRMPPGLGDRLGACLSAHAFWLARYPSRHSSANNHLIAEAAGLFLLGTLWPAHPDAPRHAAYGRRVLVEEADRQFHPDGVGAEQSPSYAALTLEWYLLACATARGAGAPFEAATASRLARAAGALRWFVDGSGNVPRIGDDDDSHVVPSVAGHEERYVAAVTAAVTAGATAGVRVGLRAAVLGTGVLGAAAPLPNPSGTRTFTDGGYTVHRSTVAGRDVLLAFDHGPLGHLSIAAHGHADALALWLHVDGEPVLVDAGTHLYHGDDGWRGRLRGTAAHNTLLLGGEDQSLTAGPFNWRRTARTALLRSAADGLDVEAEHDGYARRFGFSCRRRVVSEADGFAVLDRLVPAARARRRRPAVAIGFLLAPGLNAACEGRAVAVTRGGADLLRLSATTLLRPRVEAAAVSPRFGHLGSSLRIVFTPDDDEALDFGVGISIRSRAAARPADVRGLPVPQPKVDA